MRIKTLPCNGKLVKAESRERANVLLTETYKQIERTIYTDGPHYYIIRNGEFIEVIYDEKSYIKYKTKKGR